jgi:hypothetical protein
MKIRLPASAPTPSTLTGSRRLYIAFLTFLLCLVLIGYKTFHLPMENHPTSFLFPGEHLTTAHNANSTGDGVDPFLHEVADTMLEFYELFVKMRFLPEGSIARAPHTSAPVDTQLAATLGMSPRAIQLIQMLPVVTEEGLWGANEGPFVLGGRFMDYRDASELEQSRDPFYAGPSDTDWNDENGPYMRPDYVALSALGNHGTVLVLNLANSKYSISRW